MKQKNVVVKMDCNIHLHTLVYERNTLFITESSSYGAFKKIKLQTNGMI